MPYDHTAARVIANQSGAEKDSPLYDAIGGIVTDLAVKQNTIHTLIKTIRGRLDATELRLNSDGRGLNDLGELQSAGVALDVAIAAFNAQRHELDTLLRLASN
jgi:hypothetical protein